MHYRCFARTFDSDLNIEQMREKLNELGPWTWNDRDSERFGFYIYTGALPQHPKGIVKIFLEQDVYIGRWGDPPIREPRFVVQLNLASEAPDAEAIFKDVEQTVFASLLPALGARDITETETTE